MAKPETSRNKVVARLESEGWKNEGGGADDKFTKPGAAYPVLVPRHRTLSPGVARSIAKAAGWI
ncbi:type II toxin-antitoxin system HicA family toxin [Acidisphaera sp. S103]|uniref:type II toxin-antitoxin system HicA family toxin n=1 Tax=Acidisphaera sp. S103 TaxID=1747223 RepID=UPI00131C3823|nr:type II toxin-antitoxin system HicA family toxin [Acidisphaera sp. S103]